jgi:hypothetical protein
LGKKTLLFPTVFLLFLLRYFLIYLFNNFKYAMVEWEGGRGRRAAKAVFKRLYGAKAGAFEKMKLILQRERGAPSR